MSLLDQIAEAESELALLKRQAAAAPCFEVGHRWKLARCDLDRGPAPVYECESCGTAEC
jgi:predicted RNA-binding Zn-ribbon protein involved in translation (DUF1610 family)